jgi:iron(III) transport system permease protein
MTNKMLERPKFNFWTIIVIVIALIIASPIFCILGSLFSDSGDALKHLANTVLKDYLFNSLWLMLGVAVGVLSIGTVTAWLVTMCRFPCSRIFEWALLLPLSTPAYLLAYTYADMSDYFGFIQVGLRNIFGWSSKQDYWFPDVHSLGGAIVMLTLSLYPYVYLLARVAFLEQSVCTVEASRSLGSSPWHSFFTIALPLARPSIMAGLALALMETLNDFGTVQYLGVSTFTTGVYRTWFGLGNRVAAAQLAVFLMLFVLLSLILERFSRRYARYYQRSGDCKTLPQYKLGWLRGSLAWLVCFLPIVLGLLLPNGYLLKMTIDNLDKTLNSDFWQLSRNSFILSSVAAILAVIISLIVAYGQRLQSNLAMRLSVGLASMGYAIPGSVIAVGVLIPIGSFDNNFDRLMRSYFGISTGLLLSGTIVTLVFAYIVRFLAVAFGTIESNLKQIAPNLDDASRSLGYSPSHTLIKIHIPLLWRSLLTAAILVFVDVMKELSATIVIRPFNFDTLAVKVYQYASDERLIEASAPALAVVLVGIIPVILLSIQIAKSRVDS